MGLLLRCHASAGAVSSRCFAVCAGFGLYGSCDHQGAGARNDAPCSSVCILGKCGSRNVNITVQMYLCSEGTDTGSLAL